MNNMEYSYLCRVHLFPNGTLHHGKALAFERSSVTLSDVLLLAAKKFNTKCVPQQSPINSSPSSGVSGCNTNDIHQLHVNPYLSPYPRLFTIKGTEIGEICEILNDDVLVFVPPNEEFLPPLPLEQVILGSSAPHSHSVLTSAYHVPQYNSYASGVYANSPVNGNSHHQMTGYPSGTTSSGIDGNNLSFHTPTRPKSKTTTPSNLQAISPLLSHQQYHYQSPHMSSYPSTSASSSQQQFASPPYTMDLYEQQHHHQNSFAHSLIMGGAHMNYVAQQMSFIPELYLLIFSFLDHRDLLLHIALVSKQWNNDYAKSELLWKELCANVYYYREKRRRLYTGFSPNMLVTMNSNNTAGSSSFTNGLSVDTTSLSLRDSFSLEELRNMFMELIKPPMEYKSWKTYYRYYILWAGALTWDTTERGPNIKFQNQNMTVLRDDNITYHWQTVRATIPIHVPTEKQKMAQGGVMVSSLNGSVTDDVALFEWEIVVNKFDRSHSNGWWIVIGLETEHFPYKESTPTNLIGYDRHMGWGYACGNGDSLHCYSNTSLKNKQPFTCDPVNAWMNVPYSQGDIVRVRLKYFTKCCVDAIDPKENIGATLDYFVNGKWMGQAFRNITGTVYPAVSLLTNQAVTLRHVDPILNKMIERQQLQQEQRIQHQIELEQAEQQRLAEYRNEHDNNTKVVNVSGPTASSNSR